MGCCPSATDEENEKKAEAAVPGSSAINQKDLKRSFAGAGSYGLLHNATAMIAKDWGFDPRNSASPATKVMISYVAVLRLLRTTAPNEYRTAGIATANQH